jgi:hypothetical protein
MSSNTVIRKVRKAWFRMTTAHQISSVRERMEADRGAAEIELIMDDVRAEGIDPQSPLGLACVVEVWKEKQQEIHRLIHKDEVDPLNGGFPNGW